MIHNTITFHIIDWVLIAIYMVLIFIMVIFKSKRQHKDEVQYLLCSRKISLIPFMATLFATWYGGIFGVGEYSYIHGISTYLVFGVPFYLFTILYAIFLVPKIRSYSAISIPESISLCYGKNRGLWVVVPIFLLVSPAPYILMLSQLLAILLGGEFNIVLLTIIITCVSLGYVIMGGFSAVVRTDMVQAIMMILGFIVLSVACLVEIGNPWVLWQKLPEIHQSFHGGESLIYILVWFFIALWTFVDPSFHQRTSAVSTIKTARKGMVLSVLFWMFFDTMTIFCGMYGFVLLGDIDMPAMVYPLLAENILPMGVKGFFIMALFATIMSTLDSYLLLSGQTLGRDLLKHWFQNIPSNYLIILGMIISAIIAILLQYWFPSVVNLWFLLGSILVPGLLIPILGIYIPFFRVQKQTMVFTLCSSISISLIWYIGGLMNWHAIFINVQPFFAGLFVSILCWWWGRGQS